MDMKTALVWSYEVPHTPLALDGAHIGTGSLGPLCDLPTLWWGTNENPPADITRYDCLLVNLFCDMRHVEQIREVHPTCLIVAIPDSYFDEVFLQRQPDEELQFMRQLQAADVIGVVSNSNATFYAAFNKPIIRIPMPIGTDAFFEGVRAQAKYDAILATDHGARQVTCTISNVLVLAQVQKETGYDVFYVDPSPMTRAYAEQIGLKMTCFERLVYAEYCGIAGQAKLGIDLYTRYGFGRNVLTLNYAGTPCVASAYNQFGRYRVDPFNTSMALDMTRVILNSYEAVRLTGIHDAFEQHGFKAVRKQMHTLLGKLHDRYTSRMARAG
jgi:hypothetical protein